MCINRLLSNLFLPWVMRLAITPNQWTFLSFLLGVAAVAFISQGSYLLDLWAALLFQLFYLVDNWDGEVARVRGLSSRWGSWFDLVVDTVIHALLPLGLGFGTVAMPVGWIASGGILFDFLLTFWGKTRGFGPAVYGDPSRGKRVLGSPFVRFLKTNLTHENFSLVVAAVLVFDLRLAFLLIMAVGSQIFWIQFLVRERRRLFSSYNLAQARR